MFYFNTHTFNLKTASEHQSNMHTIVFYIKLVNFCDDSFYPYGMSFEEDKPNATLICAQCVKMSFFRWFIAVSKHGNTANEQLFHAFKFNESILGAQLGEAIQESSCLLEIDITATVHFVESGKARVGCND